MLGVWMQVQAPPGCPPVVVLPGFGNSSEDYTSPFGCTDAAIATQLSERGFQVHVVPVRTLILLYLLLSPVHAVQLLFHVYSHVFNNRKGGMEQESLNKKEARSLEASTFTHVYSIVHSIVRKRYTDFQPTCQCKLYIAYSYLNGFAWLRRLIFWLCGTTMR